MKLGPLEIRRAVAAGQPDTPPPVKAVGVSGTQNYRGWIHTDEYNSELQWPRNLPVYQRMLRSDATVREAFMHVVAPILNASWDVEAASDDPQDLEVAEFGRRAYFEWCETPFEPTLALAMKFLGWGYQVFELPEKVVEAELTYTNPVTNEQVTVPKRQFVTWQRWSHRKPETIYRWLVDDNEQLETIVQRALYNGRLEVFDIPADQVALFVCDQEGDDFTGISLLRSAQKSWWMKDLIEKVMTMSVERHGLGINTAYVNAHGDTSVVDAVENMLTDVRAGDVNNLVFPGPKMGTAGTDSTSNEQYLFEIVTPPGGLPDFSPALTYLRGEIKGNMLARFGELGHGSTGARATGDVQSEVWYDALHAVSDYVCSVHNTVFRRLVDKNYPGLERYPKLVARDIEARSLLEFAQANAQLVAAGAINADKSYRSYVREEIDAPDEDEPDESEPDPAGTEPLTDPALMTPEQLAKQRADQRQQAQAMEELRAVADRLENARKKDDRVELAEAIGRAIAAIPAPRIEVGTQHHAHAHEHHDHHAGLTADELTAALERERAVVTAEIAQMLDDHDAAAKPAAKQHVQRDEQGRLVAIREYDGNGSLIRWRQVDAYNDDGTVKSIRDQL